MRSCVVAGRDDEAAGAEDVCESRGLSAAICSAAELLLLPDAGVPQGEPPSGRIGHPCFTSTDSV